MYFSVIDDDPYHQICAFLQIYIPFRRLSLHNVEDLQNFVFILKPKETTRFIDWFVHFYPGVTLSYSFIHIVLSTFKLSERRSPQINKFQIAPSVAVIYHQGDSSDHLNVATNDLQQGTCPQTEGQDQDEVWP